MDLNNQMILMRKEIKRAKVHVISKLIRRIKSLRNKKGTEAQKLNNSNRADRLLEEINILKDIKPDIIFKQLLATDVSVNDLSNLSLKDRAITRIGLVSFIEDKMASIKKQINVFDHERTKKESVSYLQVLEKLPSSKVKGNCTVDEKTNNSTKKENIQSKTSTQSKEPKNKILEENDADTKSAKVEKMEKLEYNSEDDDKINDEIVPSAELNQEFKVVLPDYLSKPENPSINQTINLNSKKLINLAQNSTNNDISNILKNYGEGYGSDDNLSEEIIPEKDDSNEEIDLFFCDSQDAKKLKITSNKHLPPKESLKMKTKKFETTFVSSLGGEKNKRTNSQHHDKNDNIKKRKKNRLGQRARQNLYSSNLISDTHNKKSKPLNKKSKPKTGGSNSTDKNLTQEPENDATLHPSWQASQQLKKKSGIQEFKGKRITFNDSD